MQILKLIKIKKSYGDKEVLKDINLEIKRNEVIGLVGFNGAGKTTLAKIIMGEETYDSGKIDKVDNKMMIRYLKQSSEFNKKRFTDVVLDENSDINKLFEISSYLGMDKITENERFNHLSGGEKTKLSLSEVLNKPVDLLILDEPTNHLDYVGVDYLVRTIKSYTGSVLIISHDRYFLDQVVNTIAELDNGIIKMYKGNYTNYRKQKKRDYDVQLHQYEEQKKKEQHINEEIDRLKNWSKKSHEGAQKKAKKFGVLKGGKEFYRTKAKKKDIQVKSKIKRLEKMRETGVERPIEETQVLFEFVSDSKRGKNIILAENLTKEFQDKTLFKTSDFSISRGEKVGLIGVNGSGKTTLIQMILGYDCDYKGELWVSESAKIAYLSQDVLDLDENKTVNDLFSDFTKEQITKARTLLASSGVTERIIYQKIKTLSLGERTRIKLVLLILAENDILILDEPTNHLDLHSREQLEKTLEQYNGTIILASHDRYLLKKITNKLLIFEKNKIVRSELNYKEYNEKKSTKDKRDTDYQIMVIQNKITKVLSELTKYKNTDEMYSKLDKEFRNLIEEKKDLQDKKQC